MFSKVADALTQNESVIVNELNNAQGQEENLEGYYKPNCDLAKQAMRPSATFNDILASA